MAKASETSGSREGCGVRGRGDSLPGPLVGDQHRPSPGVAGMEEARDRRRCHR